MFIKMDERALTTEEQAYVAPRAGTIAQIDVIVMSATKGDSWLNELQHERRRLKRQVKNYLIDRAVRKASFADEQGGHREIDLTDPRKVIFR
jgi:hypothetical protein